MSTKFFFDFDDNGTLTVDETGLQYPTRAAARYAAVSALQSVMRDLVLNQQSRWEISVKVRDESSFFFEAKMAFSADYSAALK